MFNIIYQQIYDPFTFNFQTKVADIKIHSEVNSCSQTVTFFYC